MRAGANGNTGRWLEVLRPQRRAVPESLSSWERLAVAASGHSETDLKACPQPRFGGLGRHLAVVKLDTMSELHVVFRAMR